MVCITYYIMINMEGNTLTISRRDMDEAFEQSVEVEFKLGATKAVGQSM